MYKTGLVSISFRDKTPLEILTAMKNAGLSYVEWGSDVHAPASNLESLAEVARLQKDFGIECCSYGTYFRLGLTPIDELENYIKAAKILGTNVLRLWCGDKSTDKYTAEEKHHLFISCKTAAEIAERNEVTICLECHNNTYTSSAPESVSV